MRPLVRASVRALRGYVPGEQPRLRGPVKLNTNENPYPPSPRVARALRACRAGELRLYPDPVALALRRVIARLHRVRVAEVFVGNGSDEILALCTRAFVEDGGRIGYFVPSYSLYPVLAAIRGVAGAPVELGAAFEWRMPPRYRADLFFLANPNAPTGIQYPRRVVADFCRRFPGVVLIDEAYVDFAREHDMALAVRLPNVLVMRTLSKSYALAGLRLGYVVGARRLIGALFKLKDSYNVDRLAQRLAVAALRDRSYMRRTAARVRATRARLAAALAGRGFRVYPSETNFLWVRPPGVAARRLCAALRRRGVLVRHFAGRRTGAFLRITVGSEGEVERLRRALDGLRPKPRGGRRQRGEDGV